MRTSIYTFVSKNFALFFWLALTMGAVTASAQTFTFQSVGFVTPSGINASGALAGSFCCSYFDGFDQPQPLTHAYSLQVKGNGQLFKIAEPANAQWSIGSGISPKGDVVGGWVCAIGACTNGGMQGFLFTNSANLGVPFNVPGAVATLGGGINSSGQIVGMSCQTTTCALNYTGEAHGFLLDHVGGTFTQIDFPGSTGTLAAAINDSGDIVGIYGVCKAGAAAAPPCQAITQHGYLLSGGVYTTIDPPGSISTLLTGINKSGEITGSYATSTHGGGSAFVYQNGVFTFVSYPGASSTQINGINNQGQIVGTARVGSGTVNFIGTPQ